MKNISSKILICFFLIPLIYCANDSDKKSKQSSKTTLTKGKSKFVKNLNISFLLDLSDRINPKKYPNESMEYYLRDVAYIKSVSETFDSHLRKKKVRQMNDRIQVFFDPEPQNQNINNISNDLRYSVSRDNASLELLDEIKSVYSTKPIEIYELAIKDNNYVGSNTWRFFKSKVKDFCIEEGYRNILIILTDGYIYHKDAKIKEGNLTSYLTPQDIRNFKLNTSNWNDKITNDNFGFIPKTDSLQKLEILVLGINPDKKNPYEEDVIIKYWSDWFNKMNVKRYEIKITDLPSNMDKLIKDFIFNE
ncbi:hypothetical protein JYT89_01720 [Flavobacteriaceae bacterium AH-315-B10]|nr:hypothetical protein [Flavobacteriaceae bacterium AH-315-B10]